MRVAGDFTEWADGADLTNNPALNGTASNIYSIIIPVISFAGGSGTYRFCPSGGYDSPASTGGNNRTFQIAGGNQILPLVFHRGASPCDLAGQDITVTFVLHITNGTAAYTDNDPAYDGPLTFTKGTDTLSINGDSLGWWGWKSSAFPFNDAPAAAVLTNNPIGSDYCERTFVLPRGNSLFPQYKFSINGSDNEAAGLADIIRNVRALGSTYNMPSTEFGTNNNSTLVEQYFGNLTVGVPAGVNIPVSWLGRPCVTTQVRTNVSSGSWTDLPTNDSAQTTNWPNTGTRFFRLQKRVYP